MAVIAANDALDRQTELAEVSGNLNSLTEALARWKQTTGWPGFDDTHAFPN